jgi:hypothetical protein
MELKTKVGANLLICSDNVEANYSSETLIQGRKGLLEPVSSINGTTGSFYYTVNANARGQKESGATVTAYSEAKKVDNTVASKYGYDVGFNATYGIKTSGTDFTTSDIGMTGSGTGAAYGYIDYTFYVKATADAANQKLNLTECNIIYNKGSDSNIGSGTEAGVDIDRAWRVGVFVKDITSDGGDGLSAVQTVDPATTADVATQQKAILGLSGSDYFTSGQAQASTSALGSVVNFKNGSGDGVVLDTIATSGSTKYYKVLIRVWLEGEDDTCNSQTYAALQDGKWLLNCTLELGQGTAINALNSNTSNTADTTKTQTAVTEIDVND